MGKAACLNRINAAVIFTIVFLIILDGDCRTGSPPFCKIKLSAEIT